MVSAIVIGPGRVNFSFLFVCAPRELRLEGVHAALEPQRPHHLRHHRFVAVGADAHLDLVGEVDALDALQEAVHEVLARLLAVADDVDAGVLLLLDGEEGGVALGLLQVGALEPPRRPQLVGLGQPGRLRQAAGDGGLEHGAPPRQVRRRRAFAGRRWTGSASAGIVEARS